MKSNRRKFLKQSACVAGTAIVLPTIIPACVRGANDRINVGMIGVGTHGISRNLKQLLPIKDCVVTTVCDVDDERTEEGAYLTNSFYENKGCKTFKDFRDVLSIKDIDAIQISTPDHWHVHQAIMAIQAGKDVICEKPTLTIEQGRLLCDVIKKHDRIFATSLEDRTLKVYHRMAELVRNGRIGKLQKVRIGMPGVIKSIEELDTRTQKPPETFDYDMWLGPAPEAPYSPGRCHFYFRWINDYGGGMLSDWGAHLIDNAQWCNGTEKSGPVHVSGTGKAYSESIYDAFYQYNLKYKYENGVIIDVHSDSRELYIEGTEGALWINGWNTELEASSEKILNSVIEDNELHLSTGVNEQVNFIECVRSREEPLHPAEDMHRTATMAHMGNIAMQLERDLQWDPVKEEFLNDAVANSMRSREERDPWKLSNIII
jgi:predicted dehydrogenase